MIGYNSFHNDVELSLPLACSSSRNIYNSIQYVATNIISFIGIGSKGLRARRIEPHLPVLIFP